MVGISQKPYSLSARSKGYADERLLALPSGLRGKAGEGLLNSRCLKDIANMTAEEILNLKIDGIGKKRAMLVEQHFSKKIHREEEATIPQIELDTIDLQQRMRDKGWE